MTCKDWRQYFITNSYINENTGCWIWLKYKDPNGYGVATRKDTGKSGSAHREAYKAYNGEIPTGLLVLHTCDVPSCVNPNHLILGTQKDNMQDMISKGRSPDRKGEKGSTTKLKTEDVEYIRSFERVKGFTVFLSNLFGVSKTTISEIRKGKTWK